MPRRTTQHVGNSRTLRPAKHQAALARVFAGLEVLDATADLRIPSSAQDVVGAEQGNPQHCVLARACRRHFGSTAAVFFRTVAYVDIKGEDGNRHVERFLVDRAARETIAQFDTDGPESVPADDRWLVLRAPTPGRTLDRGLERDRKRQQRRKALKGQCEDTAAAPRSVKRTTVHELEVCEDEPEIRNGSGQWQMIKKGHDGMFGKLSAEDVIAIRQARAEARAVPTKQGTPRGRAPRELAPSLAEQYGVTIKQIRKVWDSDR